MAERLSVEVNYCPKCRGTWLDHGGLDKMIDRAQTLVTSSSRQDRPYERWDREHEERSHEHDHHDDDYRGHRKKSFFSQFFD
jgi:uncharacterized protein